MSPKVEWEYVLQTRQNPNHLVGQMDTNKVLRFKTKAEAEEFLWTLDCLLVLGLRILQVPAGAPIPVNPLRLDPEDEDLEAGR